MERYVLSDNETGDMDFDNTLSLESLCDTLASMSGRKPYSLEECITMAKELNYTIFTIS